jgi:hypothetical protein
MKVVDRVLDVQGHVGGEKVGMTIDQGALAHIMSVLTDLYSDPELACIREYSTNALDSHIEAGQKRPIEVTLPSPLSPFLRIRDYGIGLDAEGIRDIYSRYGTSTKRQSDDVVGMLGLGCKSALTYTDQFTLTGIKDGRMIQVLIGRDEDGAGSMTIVAEHDTTDEPGVEVTIPAKRNDAFASKAHRFFSFWTPGTVLVNGEQPERIDGQWITDTILITEAVDRDYVVMGNVAYPVEDNPLSTGTQRRPYWRNDYTVAFVPIGAVQFTPSREALQMTRLTKDTLAALKAERDKHLNAALKKNVAAASDAVEAIKLWQQAKQIGLTEDATYQGRVVRSELWRNSPSGGLDYRGEPLRVEQAYLVASPSRHSRYRLSGTWQSTIAIEPGNVIFTNFDGAALTPTKRAKMEHYWSICGDPPQNVARYIFIPGALTPDEAFWLDGLRTIDWSIIDAIKLPRDPNNVKKAGPTGAYKGRLPDGSWDTPILAGTIDTSKPILYYHGNRYHFQSSWEYRRGMIPGDVLVVCLEANRIEKFRRDFPSAVSTAEYAKAWAKKQVAAWDATKIKAARLQNLHGTTLLRQLPADRINDPDLKEGITLAALDVTDLRKKLVEWSEYVPDGTITNPLDKYPLLGYTRSLTGKVEIDHAVTYINAAHAAGRS